MNLNFILMEMTHLRYWMPLVIEGNKRGLQSTFYVGYSYKYNCPSRYIDIIHGLSKEHNIGIKLANNVGESEGLLFSSEKTGIDLVKRAKNTKKIISTYQTDFVESYSLYAGIADHILMPSRFIADYYNLHTDKNLYLGIPKYDIGLDQESILKKYSIPEGKKALIIWPKGRDEGQTDMDSILSTLKQQGFTLLVKTRGKDPLISEAKQTLKKSGDFYFEDTSWYPHTTQELLEISDIAINFGSTTIEECVMHNVPVINFDVKPEVRNGSKRPYRVTHDYLYNYNYCVQGLKDFSESQLIAAVNFLTSTDLTEEFKKARQNHLFNHKDTCKKILDVL
jgi:hypothetical protein